MVPTVANGCELHHPDTLWNCHVITYFGEVEVGVNVGIYSPYGVFASGCVLFLSGSDAPNPIQVEVPR